MSANRQETVVVTGGAGFVGLHIAEALAWTGRSVVALDIAEPDEFAWRVAATVDGAIRFQRCDLRDAAALRAAIAAIQPDDVIHAAAITSTPTPQALAMVDVHVRATQILLDLAQSGAFRRLVYLSSAGVFQSPAGVTSLDEDYPVTLDGPYSITKHAAERLVHVARISDETDAVTLRLPAIYGPYERPTGSRLWMSTIHTAVRLVRSGTPITVNGPGILRDWTHAADVGSGVVRALDTATIRRSLYHLGIGQGYTLRETLAAVADVLPGADISWVETAEQASLPMNETSHRAPLAIDRARTDLGYAPAFKLTDGVRDYVASLD